MRKLTARDVLTAAGLVVAVIGWGYTFYQDGVISLERAHQPPVLMPFTFPEHAYIRLPDDVLARLNREPAISVELIPEDSGPAARSTKWTPNEHSLDVEGVEGLRQVRYRFIRITWRDGAATDHVVTLNLSNAVF